MKRNISIEEISDGRLYSANDMVKVGCNDCANCSACCQGMGSSIILDPLDMFRLTTGLKLSFEELMVEHIELNVVDGVILPNLKMSGEQEQCTFLNQQDRCSIHAFRPGICRLFPLGRYYKDGHFQYFLQINECVKENRTKIKVSKWMDTQNLKKYEAFVIQWHYFLNEIEALFQENKEDDFQKNLNMYLLKQFYIQPYNQEADFYQQFEERMETASGLLEL